MSDWLDQVETDSGGGGAVSYPFSDEYMKYDYTRHRYVLTEKGVEVMTGINLRKQVNTAIGQEANLTQYYLRLISDKIYNFIYSRSDNKTLLEFILAKSQTSRQMLFDAMIAQTVYFVTNGDVSQFAGVNIKNGTVMDRKAIKANSISPDAENILLNTDIPELEGNTVLYQGRFYYRDLPTYEAGGY